MNIRSLKWYFNLITLFTCLIFSIQTSATSEAVHSQIKEFKQQWAHIKYELSGPQQLAALESLIKRGEYLVSQNPNSAPMALWQGTALSTYGSIKGGLGALSAAKKARKFLDAALSMDPRVEQGQAHAILGALYSKVPGKPLGFGDKHKAEYHLKTALNMNPNNIDAHFYYGEFLQNNDDKIQAKEIYTKGLKTTPNQELIVADKGRRAEIQKALVLLS